MSDSSRIDAFRNFGRCLAVVAVLAGVCVTSPREAAAQGVAEGEYDVLPVFDKMVGNTTEARKLRTAAMSIGRMVVNDNSTAAYSQYQSTIERWFKEYYFAVMTHPEYFDQLAKMRTDFLMQYVRRARNADVHDAIVNLAFSEMSAIATGNYHPAARYNAMLLIGELNDEEMSVGAVTIPPIPLAAARRFMVAELNKANQSGVTKVAILLGLLRHVEAERVSNQLAAPQDQIPAPEEAEISKLMMDIVNAKDPQGGLSPSGQAWLRGRAIDVLAAHGAVGQDASVFNALMSVASDKEAPFSLRCVAAKGLGRLNYQGGAIDAVAAAEKLGALASAGTLQEIKRIEDQKKLAEEKAKSAQGAPGGGIYGNPSYDGGGDADASYDEYQTYGGAGMMQFGGLPISSSLTDVEQEYASDLRRRNKYLLWCARQGLTGSARPLRKPRDGDPVTYYGIHAAAKDDSEIKKIQGIVDALTAIDNQLDAPDEDDKDEEAPKDWEGLLKGIRAKANLLASLLPRPASPAAPELPGGLPGLPGGEPATPPGLPGSAPPAPNPPEAVGANPPAPAAGNGAPTVPPQLPQ